MNTMLAAILVSLPCLAAADDAPKKPEVKQAQLQSELLRRVAEDQEARKSLIKWMKENGVQGAGMSKLNAETQAKFESVAAKVKEIDTRNTKSFKDVLEKHGWPTAALVGKDGADAAWLLVQHADAHPKFQRHCLDLMKKLPLDAVSQSNLAYLTDRVLLAEGKKQVYGTQFTQAEGKWIPRPLEDAENVDKRRAKAGLPPLAEYIKLIEKMYGQGGKQKVEENIEQ